MTMKRVLHCTLMLMVLVTAGCGFWSDESTSRPNANPSPTPPTESKTNSQPPAVKPVKDESKEAAQKSGTENTQTNHAEDTKGKGLPPRRGTSKPVGSNSPKIEDPAEAGKNEANRDTGSEAENANKPNEPATTTSNPPSSATQPPVKAESGTGFDWQSILIWSAEIILGLLAVILLAAAVSYLWK